MRLLVVIWALFLSSQAFADIHFRSFDDPDAEPWREREYTLPAFPKEENLIEFYVSAVSTAKFFIDKNSISIGQEDGVVRYTVVVKTSGGATNISYEGLLCEQSKLKIYATGTTKGTWSTVPNPDWKPLKGLSLRQHQGSLARYYFCPNFVPIFTPEEGVNALKRGSHPDAPGEN